LSHSSLTPAVGRLAQLGPALLGASSFAFSDVVLKVTLQDGADVLTISFVRGLIGLLMLLVWLRMTGRRPADFPSRGRWIALGLGVVFAGNVFLLFKAIEAIEVPIAILTYFVYPLLTGIVAAATGLDRLTWRGAAAAVVALLGLALMIGAHPTGLAVFGIVAALAAAGCRVLMLLVTRATMQGADALTITWYSMLSSTVVFTVAALALLNWQPPLTATGWIWLALLGVTTTTGILGVFASTQRIGPFRTALFMNLEPPLTAVGSALLLGEFLTPLQVLGGAVMVGALAAFQWRR
jgi:drug/metabolite transporter (DMT)-like permease